MKIVAPVAYTIRGIPKTARTRVADHHVADIVEWEVPEVSSDETSLAIELRTGTAETIWEPTWDRTELRHFRDALIFSPGKMSPLKGWELPHFVGGKVQSNYIVGFVGLFDFKPYGQFVNVAVHAVDNAAPSSIGMSAEDRFSLIETSTKAVATAEVEAVLESLVLVDGILWRKVTDPKLCVCVYEDHARAYVDPGELPPRERDSKGNRVYEFPLTEAERLQDIAAALGKPLWQTVLIDSISDQWKFPVDPTEKTVLRAVRETLAETASQLGGMPREDVLAWMEVRDMLRDADSTSTATLREACSAIRELPSVVVGPESSALFRLLETVYPKTREPGTSRSVSVPAV